MFFVKTVFVPPSRFRPESKMGDEKYLHDHTNMLERILKNNIELKTLMIQDYLEEICAKDGEKGKRKKESELKAIKSFDFTHTSWFARVLKKFKHKNDFINKWLELQDSVNCFIDAAKSSKQADKDSKGLRQILERKEGLFRMKMMGKRVNYAARSVISPDPSLNTN
jgi:DNA-directed RNA polymerase I subunit RPA1